MTTQLKRLQSTELFIDMSRPSQTFKVVDENGKTRAEYKATSIRDREADLQQIDQLIARMEWDLAYIETDANQNHRAPLTTFIHVLTGERTQKARANIAPKATSRDPRSNLPAQPAASHKFTDPKLNSALSLMSLDLQVHKEIQQMAAQDAQEEASLRPKPPAPKTKTGKGLDPLVDALLAHDTAGGRSKAKRRGY